MNHIFKAFPNINLVNTSCMQYPLFVPSFFSVRGFAADPNVDVLYKMEVLREVDSRTRPLFRITMDNGEEVI